jgi:hypothetical protein
MNYIRNHKIFISTLLFFALFFAVHTYKPSMIYNREGGFRPFGIGYRHKTVVPIWIVSILLAIFSYLLVLRLT